MLLFNIQSNELMVYVITILLNAQSYRVTPEEVLRSIVERINTGNLGPLTMLCLLNYSIWVCLG